MYICTYIYIPHEVHANVCMYVPAQVYTKTSVSTLSEELRRGSMVSEHSSIPRGISHLPRSSGALSSIWQIASLKCYILYFLARAANSPRAIPFSQPGEITRHRVCNVHEICIFFKRPARGLLHGDVRPFVFLSTLT